jgi:hypothetical protein
MIMMSDNIVKLADEALENVSGGMTRNLKAAYACINGDYGNGEARFAALRKAGFDPNVVQGLVNDLLKYEKVAKDVIDGKYGNGQARVNALRAAGYDAALVQDLVNNLLW